MTRRELLRGLLTRAAIKDIWSNGGGTFIEGKDVISRVTYYAVEDWLGAIHQVEVWKGPKQW